jgi:hypothetical protein
MALGICVPSPRIQQVAARPIFCLIKKKMAEGDAFVHAAAVYHFEKVRACIRGSALVATRTAIKKPTMSMGPSTLAE